MKDRQVWRDVPNTDRVEKVNCEVLEINGNLAYVEDENGNRDWVSPHELDY